MDNHERRLGREDAERIRNMNPSGKVEDMVRALIEEERSVGFGVVQIRLPENPVEPIKFEVINPIMTRGCGCRKKFGLVVLVCCPKPFFGEGSWKPRTYIMTP